MQELEEDIIDDHKTLIEVSDHKTLIEVCLHFMLCMSHFQGQSS
jgi:hypothetical protein